MIREFPGLEHDRGYLGVVVVPKVAFRVQEAMGAAGFQGQWCPHGVWLVGEHDEPTDVVEHAAEKQGLACGHLGLDGEQSGQDAAGDAVAPKLGHIQELLRDM